MLVIVSDVARSAETSTQPVSEARVVWIEAEGAVTHNFSPGYALMMSEAGRGASDGKYLRLYTQGKKGDVIRYFAEYEFVVPVAGVYRFWIASTPNHAGWTSPLRYRIDDRPVVSLKDKAWVGEAFGLEPEVYLGWTPAGDVKLSAGTHRLMLETREARSDGLALAFVDAMFFTTDRDFVPRGEHPTNSPHPTWASMMGRMSYAEYTDQSHHWLYHKKMAHSHGHEQLGEASEAEVIRKIMARPLPKAEDRRRPTRFAVHGMATRFIVAGENREKTSRAYEMLARVGVESFRTWDGMWFQLGEKADQFGELDFQVAQAEKYHQTLMLMIGYPPAKYAHIAAQFTAVNPKYEEEYRHYLRALLTRYKDRGVIEFVELGNEVDAPEVWWKDATPAMYVNEARIVREELDAIDPAIRFLAFGATYSRDEATGAPDGGRAFVRKCFDLGIDRYVDGYSMHYTWSTDQYGFPAFFRSEMAKRGISKPLYNSEEASYGPPHHIIKAFARDLYLHDMKRVDYYNSRDWFEVGLLISSGLFDYDWNPKLRLLPYAVAVDAMRDRELVGIASPGVNVEAYVLKRTAGVDASIPMYSIVLWRNQSAEKINPLTADASPATSQPASRIAGMKGVLSAVNWRLESVSVDCTASALSLIEDQPMVVFASELPEWSLMTREQWLKTVAEPVTRQQAVVPTQ
jgi:hypothetical protein